MKYILSFLLFIITLTGFSQVNGTIVVSHDSKLHYKTFGKGNPVLIINGGPGMNCDGFSYVAEEISKLGYQTIIYDQRGTGLSSVKKIDPEHISLELMTQDIEKLRKSLKISKWTILGHSFGGMLAAYYATKHPDNIDKLIFSSSGGVNMNFTRYAQSRIADNLTKVQKDSLDYYQQKMSNGDATEITKKLRAKYLANAYVFNKANASIIAQRLTQVDFEINSIVFQDMQRNFDCTDKFSNFKQPVLVLQGENDIISIETAKENAAAFPNSKLVLMKNCGHYGWLDAKELYFNSIKHFLKS
ncbi:alpha/beta fold hydrolase [Flavobacterium pedocola]